MRSGYIAVGWIAASWVETCREAEYFVRGYAFAVMRIADDWIAWLIYNLTGLVASSGAIHAGRLKMVKAGQRLKRGVGKSKEVAKKELTDPIGSNMCHAVSQALLSGPPQSQRAPKECFYRRRAWANSPNAHRAYPWPWGFDDLTCDFRAEEFGD